MFRDRRDAGRRLAKRLKKYSGGAVVCAIPRGGVVLGVEIARKLNVPLGLVIVRKIGHPENLEYAVGVVSEKGLLTSEAVELADLDQKWLGVEIIKAKQEIRRRKKKYLAFGGWPRVRGKTVILVDDGVATGLTFLAAIRELRVKGVGKIVAALPVASKEALRKIKGKVEKVVLLERKMNLGAVGAYYEEFSQVSDEEVIGLLESLR